MKDKTMVIGYFNNNLGDDLFIKILLEKYSKNKFKLVGNRIYLETFKKYDNLKIINTDKFIFRIFRYISRKTNNMDRFYRILSLGCTRNVYIGGSLFIESNDLEEQCKYYRSLISNKKKSYLYGCNFGPYKTNNFFEFFQNYIDCFEEVCFREEYSYNLFKEKNNVRYSPDIVFNLNKFPKRTKNNKVIISVKKISNKEINDIYIAKISEISKYLIQHNYEICFMSFCKNEGDEEAIERILLKLPNIYKKKVEKYYYSNNMDEALEKINDATYVIATRYHAMIIGFLFEKITIPIVYNIKMTNVLNDINYKGLVFNIENLEEISNEKIINYFLNPECVDLKNIKDLAKNCFNKLDDELL